MTECENVESAMSNLVQQNWSNIVYLFTYLLTYLLT